MTRRLVLDEINGDVLWNIAQGELKRDMGELACRPVAP